MFPLLYFVITFVSIKQILTGTTPLNQTFQNSFPILYFYSEWRESRSKEAIRHIVENIGYEYIKAGNAGNHQRKLTFLQWS